MSKNAVKLNPKFETLEQPELFMDEMDKLKQQAAKNKEIFSASESNYRKTNNQKTY